MKVNIDMRIGDVVTFTAHGYRFEVRKLKRDEFALFKDGVERCRFGNRQQITEDIEYAIGFGCLPPRCKNQIA